MTSIEYGAFSQNQLTSVVMQSSVPPSMSHAFDTFNKDFQIYVPKGSGDAYRNHKDWEFYKDLIVEQ